MTYSDNGTVFVQEIIIGATALGCAYACENPASCMILEPSMLVGSEFSAVFRCYPVDMGAELSESGQRFRLELLRRNLVDQDGRISIVPVSGMLAERIIEKDIPVQLMARVETVKKTAQGYDILYFGMDGYAHISCGRIIDTTQTGALRGAAEGIAYKKSLSAMLSSDKRHEEYQSEDGNVSILQGRFETEQALRVYVKGDADYQHARARLMSEWDKLSEKELDGRRIAAIAAFFDYEYEKPVNRELSKNYTWTPSASYGNVLDAFEAGVLLGRVNAG